MLQIQTPNQAGIGLEIESSVNYSITELNLQNISLVKRTYGSFIYAQEA